MCKKPVITFGKPFYGDKGITLDCKNLYELPELINKAKEFEPDRGNLILVWYQNTYPPDAYVLYSPSVELKKEDIELFCNSVIKYIKLKTRD